MIIVCSLFRDNVADVKRCFHERSKWHVDQSRLLHICVEGDSTDGTYEALCAMKTKYKVIVAKLDSNKPKYPSVIEPERLSILGKTSNHALEIAIAERPTHVMWTDSDTVIGPDVVPQLIADDKDVVAPMFFFENSVFFRDTWGYRSLKGEEFTNRPSYLVGYDRHRPFEVSSVGLPLINFRVLEAGARFTEEEEIVGLCRNVRKLGFRIYCDPRVKAEHPRMGIEVPSVYERPRK